MNFTGSGAVWSSTQFDFKPQNHAGTIAGVQEANDRCETAGGGTVYIASGLGLVLATTSMKIGNRVRWLGIGDHTTTPTFTANASTNVTAMVENKTQDGTQQYAYLENISIFGNRGSGAIVSAGLRLKGIFAGSRVKDVLVYDCSGNGCVIDGGSSPVVGIGQMLVDNLAVVNCLDHLMLVDGAADHITFTNLTAEIAAAGKACVKVTRNTSATANTRHQFFNLHMEGTTAHDGLWLAECSRVVVIGATYDGNGSANNLIKITGSTTGSDGAFCAGGHVFMGLDANLTTIIDDQVAGVTLGNAQGRYIPFYRSPVASATKDKSQIVGVHVQRMGEDVASASTVDIYDGSLIRVTGVTAIDNFSNAARYKGKRVAIQTTGALTIKHLSGGTGNIRCTGGVDLVTTANDKVDFDSDGTLWWQATPLVAHA